MRIVPPVIMRAVIPPRPRMALNPPGPSVSCINPHGAHSPDVARTVSPIEKRFPLSATRLMPDVTTLRRVDCGSTFSNPRNDATAAKSSAAINVTCRAPLFRDLKWSPSIPRPAINTADETSVSGTRRTGRSPIHVTVPGRTGDPSNPFNRDAPDDTGPHLQPEAAASACSRSARMSSICSRPSDKRT